MNFSKSIETRMTVTKNDDFWVCYTNAESVYAYGIGETKDEAISNAVRSYRNQIKKQNYKVLIDLESNQYAVMEG